MRAEKRPKLEGVADADPSVPPATPRPPDLVEAGAERTVRLPDWPGAGIVSSGTGPGPPPGAAATVALPSSSGGPASCMEHILASGAVASRPSSLPPSIPPGAGANSHVLMLGSSPLAVVPPPVSSALPPHSGPIATVPAVIPTVPAVIPTVPVSASPPPSVPAAGRAYQPPPPPKPHQPLRPPQQSNGSWSRGRPPGHGSSSGGRSHTLRQPGDSNGVGRPPAGRGSTSNQPDTKAVEKRSTAAGAGGSGPLQPPPHVPMRSTVPPPAPPPPREPTEEELALQNEAPLGSEHFVSVQEILARQHTELMDLVCHQEDETMEVMSARTMYIDALGAAQTENLSRLILHQQREVQPGWVQLAQLSEWVKRLNARHLAELERDKQLLAAMVRRVLEARRLAIDAHLTSWNDYIKRTRASLALSLEPPAPMAPAPIAEVLASPSLPALAIPPPPPAPVSAPSSTVSNGLEASGDSLSSTPLARDVPGTSLESNPLPEVRALEGASQGQQENTAVGLQSHLTLPPHTPPQAPLATPSTPSLPHLPSGFEFLSPPEEDSTGRLLGLTTPLRSGTFASGATPEMAAVQAALGRQAESPLMSGAALSFTSSELSGARTIHSPSLILSSPGISVLTDETPHSADASSRHLCPPCDVPPLVLSMAASDDGLITSSAVSELEPLDGDQRRIPPRSEPDAPLEVAGSASAKLPIGGIHQADDGDSDPNNDWCDTCRGTEGHLLCCDGCPRAFHLDCIGVDPENLPPAPWFCSVCQAKEVGKTEKGEEFSPQKNWLRESLSCSS